MTDEEKSNEYLLDQITQAFREYAYDEILTNLEESYAKGYKDGLAEGRKELEKENEQLKCDLYNTDANLQHITIEYEKENAELSDSVLEFSNSVIELTNLVTELENKVTELEKQIEKDLNDYDCEFQILKAQIEKMKCCENCKKHRNRECSEDKKFYARVKRICNEWEFAENEN